MKRSTLTGLAALALLPLVACVNLPTTATELAYQIDKPVTALVIDARAASVEIVTADGPVTVTEEHRYSRGRPVTAHEVEGTTVRLTESGCGDDELRCDVRYRIRMPAAMSARITAQAGTVDLSGLTGDIEVRTQAGTVNARALRNANTVVETSAGAAYLEFVEAPTSVRARTHAGAVELRVPGTTTYAVDVHTSVGAAVVDVDTDSSSSHRLHVSTDVGAVKIQKLP